MAGPRRVHVSITADLDFDIELTEKDEGVDLPDSELADVVAENFADDMRKTYGNSPDAENFLAHAEVKLSTLRY